MNGDPLQQITAYIFDLWVFFAFRLAENWFNLFTSDIKPLLVIKWSFGGLLIEVKWKIVEIFRWDHVQSCTCYSYATRLISPKFNLITIYKLIGHEFRSFLANKCPQVIWTLNTVYLSTNRIVWQFGWILLYITQKVMSMTENLFQRYIFTQWFYLFF